MRSNLKNCLWLLSFLVFSPSFLAAADVSGTWQGSMQQKTESGETASTSIAFHLKQEGSQVSGTAGPSDQTPGPIHDAKLDGNHLKFTAGGGDGPTWKFDLKVAGDSMLGKAEGKSASGRSFGTAEVSMSRQK